MSSETFKNVKWHLWKHPSPPWVIWWHCRYPPPPSPTPEVSRIIWLVLKYKQTCICKCPKTFPKNSKNQIIFQRNLIYFPTFFTSEQWPQPQQEKDWTNKQIWKRDQNLFQQKRCFTFFLTLIYYERKCYNFKKIMFCKSFKIKLLKILHYFGIHINFLT